MSPAHYENRNRTHVMSSKQHKKFCNDVDTQIQCDELLKGILFTPSFPRDDSACDLLDETFTGMQACSTCCPSSDDESNVSSVPTSWEDDDSVFDDGCDLVAHSAVDRKFLSYVASQNKGSITICIYGPLYDTVNSAIDNDVNYEHTKLTGSSDTLLSIIQSNRVSVPPVQSELLVLDFARVNAESAYMTPVCDSMQKLIRKQLDGGRHILVLDGARTDRWRSDVITDLLGEENGTTREPVILRYLHNEIAFLTDSTRISDYVLLWDSQSRAKYGRSRNLDECNNLDFAKALLSALYLASAEACVQKAFPAEMDSERATERGPIDTIRTTADVVATE